MNKHTGEMRVEVPLLISLSAVYGMNYVRGKRLVRITLVHLVVFKLA